MTIQHQHQQQLEHEVSRDRGADPYDLICPCQTATLRALLAIIIRLPNTTFYVL